MVDFREHEIYRLERHTSSSPFTSLSFALVMCACLAASCGSNSNSKPRSVPPPVNAAPNGAAVSVKSASDAGSRTAPDPGKTRLTFDSVDALMRSKLGAGAEVELRGVVTVNGCKAGTRPCVFMIADDLLASPTARVDVLVLGDVTHLPSLQVGDGVHLAARLDLRGESGPFWKYWLHLVSVTVTEPAKVVTAGESTFTDGSWSIEDVLNVTPGTPVTITGYVTDIYLCPPCPKGAYCAPCDQDGIVLADIPKGGTALIHVALEPHSLASIPVRGRRYQFTGILDDPSPSAMPPTARSLKYKSHRPAPSAPRRRSNHDDGPVEPRN